ncbi:MAG: N4-gp56 family major capsid protein [Clostridia bacterium]|nr:N4-gp56 family major capsid protein [Clostridia bacterium]
MAVNSLANSTTSGYVALSAENKTFYDRTLLKRLLPQLVFAKYGQKKTMKKGEGDTINFRRFTSLPAATTPLTEGVTPEGRQLTIEPVTATLKQYGDYIEITDVLDMVGIDPVATENAELLGEQAGLTIDTVVRDIVCAGTNVQYAGGGTSATEKISAAEIQKAVRTLKKANAKPLADGSYIGIIDPDIAFDIMNDPLWQDISKYSGGTKIMDGEIGKLAGVRFIETTNTKINSGAHCAMIIGADAYGVVDLEGSATNKPEIIIKPLGSGGTTDPLNQRGTQGWKAMFTAARLNELAMIRLEVTVTE